MPFERIIHECDLVIEDLKQKNPPEEIDFDINFWETMKEVIPKLLQRLSDADILSHPMTANMALDVIGRAINHRTLGAPVHTIEEDPSEWFDPSQNIDKAMEFVNSLYGEKIDDGYMLQNRRCSSIFYDPYTKTYSDIELSDGYYNDLTGIGWTGNPYNKDFVKKYAPAIFERLNMDRFNFDSKIQSFPYYPVETHKSLPCTWEEECIWDFLYVASMTMDTKFEVNPSAMSYGRLHGYLFVIRYHGSYENDSYLLYILPIEGENERDFCVVHLMQYVLPYDMKEDALNTIKKSHMDFMQKLIPSYPQSIMIFQSGSELLEREDCHDPTFTFFIPLDDVNDDRFQSGNEYHINNKHDSLQLTAIPTVFTDKQPDVAYEADIFDIVTPDDAPSDIPASVLFNLRKVYDMIVHHDKECAKRAAEIREARVMHEANVEHREIDDPTTEVSSI